MELVERLRGLEGLDIATSTPGEVVTAADSIRRLRGFLSAKEAELARRSADHHAAGVGHSAEDVIQNGARVSQREAARTTKRATTLGDTPAMSDRLAAGRISPEHVDAVADAAGRLTDDDRRRALRDMDTELADAASSKTPEQFRRFVNKTANQLADDDGIGRSERQRELATLATGHDDDTGMGWLRITLHPDDHQSVRRAIDAEVAALRKSRQYQGRPFARLAATAFMNLFRGDRTSRPAPSEVLVLIDDRTLVDGVHRDTISEYADGAPLPAEAARRHACTADIVGIVVDPDGQPLNVGRTKRQATAAQRRALRAMYRTCAVDGCEHGFERCEIHHLRQWERGGSTDLDNLLPICTYHHHRAHEGRWRLQLDPSTRQLDVWLPDGTHHSTCLPDMMHERQRAA